MNEGSLRDLLGRLLSWEDAHVGFDNAVASVPAELRGRQPAGLPYSLWQLVEHLRIAQHDILDFCRNPHYKEHKWPDDYWPAAEPPSPGAWDESISAFRRDLAEVKAMAADTSLDLDGKIPHGSGQTYLRELVLIADHNAYHVGQVILVRRLLGIWPPKTGDQ